MNRYEQLKRGESKIAVLGLNTEGLRYSLELAKRFPTYIFDRSLPANLSLDQFLSLRGIELNTDYKSFQLAPSGGELRAAGVFYLNGLSYSKMDWESIRDTARIIGQNLSVGDWVILGPHIDPDLAEVLLLELFEKNSGLRIGNGFEVAFHPAVVGSLNFENLGNEMKLSHNLIISQVEKILNFRKKNDYDTNQINYQHLDQELLRIKSKVQSLWIPMLNGMTKETFTEFVDLSIHKGFLDAYSHLRLSTESKVNWKRFFEMVLRAGIKSEFAKIIKSDYDLKLAV